MELLQSCAKFSKWDFARIQLKTDFGLILSTVTSYWWQNIDPFSHTDKHYLGVTRTPWHLKLITEKSIGCLITCSVWHRENIKASYRWPFARKNTCDRWIPLIVVIFSVAPIISTFGNIWNQIILTHTSIAHKHDDVIKWKHFPRYWPFLRGIHRFRWIPCIKASDAELWCFLWSAPE